MNIAEELGKRIQKLRKARKMTQSQLAEKIGVEIVTISRIENGSRFPMKENLENIAKILDVQVKDLFDFDCINTKTELTNNIHKMLKSASLEDLKYINKLLFLYFETK